MHDHADERIVLMCNSLHKNMIISNKQNCKNAIFTTTTTTTTNTTLASATLAAAFLLLLLLLRVYVCVCVCVCVFIGNLHNKNSIEMFSAVCVYIYTHKMEYPFTMASS